MKAAIVTGAGGFIGAPFVNYLLSNGYFVLALGRKKLGELSARKRRLLMGAEYMSVDMDDINKLPELLKKTSGIPESNNLIFFNLAWGGLNSLSDLDVEAQLTNISRSLNCMLVADELGCSSFIQIGTMEEAFAEKYLSLKHNETSVYNRHLIYSIAKINAHKALKLKAAELGLRFIYVLHSHVMGPEDTKDSFLQVTLEKFVNKEKNIVFSTGEQTFDVISVDDCIHGYFLICEIGQSHKRYWVGSGEPRPLREYVERMHTLFPSGDSLKFGTLPYNDIQLSTRDFAIDELARDTKYEPKKSYEETVIELHAALFNTTSEDSYDS